LLPSLEKTRRSFYFNLFNQFTGFQKTGQMQFTPPVQVVYALRRAINEYFEEGEAGRWDRYRENWQTLYEGLESMNFEFLLPRKYESQILVAVKEPVHPAYNFDKMHDYLYDRGYTIYPGKGAKEATFRLSILGDLRKVDILSFLRELKGYLEQL
jgi:2-aminoethylphosphonate-pyruvate transaminase